MNLNITCEQQSIGLNQVFRISRGAKTNADVIVVKVTDGEYQGWAEAVPYPRYGETSLSAQQQIMNIVPKLTSLVDPLSSLKSLMPAGAARNALDCALWDLKSQQQGSSAATLLGLPEPTTCTSAQTLSIDSVDNMRQAAWVLRSSPLIKVKLDANDILEKIRGIHDACPQAKIIIDANEAWDMPILTQVAQPLSELNVVMIEQPLPKDADEELRGFSCAIALCADESCHTTKDLSLLAQRYQAVNIKLDKAGGLSEALAMFHEARKFKLMTMLGCMVGTSLGMAPAYLLAHLANYVDLDGPLWVANDRPYGFDFTHGKMRSGANFLWGTGNKVG
ncbi:MAG: L-alanine-DL-glutamate epimerase-like enolase superfamily enzyme [Paraglaciecola sp.]|jgi:L-alanine-DL-glutamate epimerase-like enolase superfamily enzyme